MIKVDNQGLMIKGTRQEGINQSGDGTEKWDTDCVMMHNYLESIFLQQKMLSGWRCNNAVIWLLSAFLQHHDIPLSSLSSNPERIMCMRRIYTSYQLSYSDAYSRTNKHFGAHMDRGVSWGGSYLVRQPTMEIVRQHIVRPLSQVRVELT